MSLEESRLIIVLSMDPANLIFKDFFHKIGDSEQITFKHLGNNENYHRFKLDFAFQKFLISEKF